MILMYELLRLRSAAKRLEDEQKRLRHHIKQMEAICRNPHSTRFKTAEAQANRIELFIRNFRGESLAEIARQERRSAELIRRQVEQGRISLILAHHGVDCW